MKITDENIKRFTANARKRRPRGTCPEEEALAGFVEGKLDEKKTDSVLGHVARCASCAHVVMTLRELMTETEKENDFRVPISALEKAARLDPNRKTMMDVVIEFAKGAAKLLSASAGVLGSMTPSAELVRGEGTVVSENLVTLTKEFDPFSAEVDVEKTRPDRAEITIKLVDKKSGSPASGLRVSLYEKDLERESAMLDGGLAVFEDLKFGQYRLEITRVGEPVGRITLEMKGEGK